MWRVEEHDPDEWLESIEEHPYLYFKRYEIADKVLWRIDAMISEIMLRHWETIPTINKVFSEYEELIDKELADEISELENRCNDRVEKLLERLEELYYRVRDELVPERLSAFMRWAFNE